ncbi:MAG: CARDB domain-containing protein, partial [Bacteroidota bacterium]
MKAILKSFWLCLCFCWVLPLSTQHIIEAEFFWDHDPGAGNGTSIAISPTADSISQDIDISIPSLDGYLHTLFVRTKDANGKWSIAREKQFGFSSTIDIVELEYFWDQDPGVGNGTQVDISDGLDVMENININVPNLGGTLHTLFVRAKNNAGQWSLFRNKEFYIQTGLDIVIGEYYWNDDPGFGNGTALTLSMASDSLFETFDVDVPSDIPLGGNYLFVRFKNGAGQWSFPREYIFLNNTVADIVAAEYFWDQDPGFGSGTALPISSPGQTSNEQYNIPITGLTSGQHYLCVRVKDSRGVWSITKHDSILVTGSVYVDHTATGNNDGTSWADAYTELKTALDNIAGVATTIRVAEGMYYPDLGSGSRDSFFVINSGIILLGGYPNGGDIDDNRNWETYPTILSGNIGDTNLDTDNSYHVVYTNGVSNVTADGFTIQGGYANGSNQEQTGGGWLNDGNTNPSNPSIVNCVFKNNFASAWGGGMYNQANAGGVASPNYEDCIFQNNRANNHGGAVINYGGAGGSSSPNFLNCVFDSNQIVSQYGGAIFNDGFGGTCNAAFINCLFSNNTGVNGGAISNFGGTNVQIINSTFAYNKGTNGHQIHNETIGGNTNTEVINSVFIDSTDGVAFYYVSGAALNLRHSILVEVLPPGTTDNGNNLFNSDPLFTNADMQDYTLSGNSPALNVGDNSANATTEDLEGNTRIYNSIIDLGAFESLSDACQINFNLSGACTGTNQVLSGDTIFLELTNLNGSGPFNIVANGIAFDSLYSGIPYPLFVEGEDFSGVTPYQYEVIIDTIFDINGACLPNMDTSSFLLDVLFNLEVTASDSDGFVCAGEDLVITVPVAGYLNYTFFDDMNMNGIAETAEVLQSGNSNVYTLNSNAVGSIFNIACSVDLGNCISVTDPIISTIVGNPNASISFSEQSGQADNDGQLCFGDTLTLTGIGNGGFLWNTGDTASNIAVATGNLESYWLEITSQENCVDTAFFTPNIDPEIQINEINVNDISCYGETDGIIHIEATGGSNTFNYTLNTNIQSNGLFNNLLAGNYALEIVDTNTCSVERNYLISEPDTLVSLATPTDEQCFQDSSGLINIISAGGVGPYYYVLENDTSDSPSFTDLTIGDYTLQTIDANNCIAIQSVTINGNDSLVIAIAQKINASCNTGSSDGEITFAVTGGAGNYAYDIGSGSQTSPTFTNLIAGNYTLIVSDNNGCTKSLDFEIASENLSATFTLSNHPQHDSSVVFPSSGSQYDVFRFEINYTDPNNAIPQASYPRMFLDFEGNGIYNNSNDRIYVLAEDDPSDQDMTDGKIYFTQAQGIPIGSNWEIYILALDANGCEVTYGPVDGPEVLANPNVFIYANDINFSNTNPDLTESFDVSTKISNSSSFEASNFEVLLYNDYTNEAEDSIMVSSLPAGSSIDLTWSVTAPSTDAWVPYRVFVDNDNVIDESNELDNTASKAVIVGDFQLPISMEFVSGPSIIPVSGYPGTSRQLTGKLVYDGFMGTLPDSTVKGAEVIVLNDQTGETFTVYTDNQGNFTALITGPAVNGNYTLSGTISDQTITKVFSNVGFNVIPYPPSCSLPDLAISADISNVVVNSGTMVSGIITVTNIGCNATPQSVLLSMETPGANVPLGNYHVPQLDVGESWQLLVNLTYPTEGFFFLSAYVDADFEITELNEGNNALYRTVRVADDGNLVAPICNQIDITPDDAFAGEIINVIFPINNIGFANVTDSFIVALNIDGNEYTDTIKNGINAGANKLASFAFPKPLTLNNLNINVDQFNEVNEKDETDNTYHLSLCPDLSIIRPGLPSGQAFWEKAHPINEQVDFLIGIANSGSIQTAEVEVLFEIMGPGYPSWTNIGEELISLTSNLCGQNRISRPTLPFAFIEEGTYQVRITVDSPNIFMECNEMNNDSVFNVVVENLADLKTESAFINPSSLNPDVNESINIDISYKNLGASNLSDSFQLRVSIDTSVLEELTVAGLPENGIATIQLSNTWSSDSIGPHLITVELDPQDSIAELSENNNMATRSIIVGLAPNLFIESLALSDSMPLLGDNIQVNTTIINEGGASCAADLLFYYLNTSGDSILFDMQPIALNPNDTSTYSAPFSVNQNSNRIIVRIVDASPLEYNLLDNQAIIDFTTGTQCNLTVSNTNDSGQGSLRQCIECANTLIGRKLIDFNIPGNGPHVISLLSRVVISADSVVLDATTQADNLPMNGRVVIDGSNISGTNITMVVVTGR